MSKYFIIALTILVGLINFSESATPNYVCKLCLERSESEKDQLTSEFIEEVRKEMHDYCEYHMTAYERTACKQWNELEYERQYYLLEHDLMTYCVWRHQCSVRGGDRGFISTNNLIGANFSKLNSWNDCQECMTNAAKVKQALDAYEIREIIDRETEKCYLIRDDDSKQECLDDVAKLKDTLNFLFTNRVEDYCTYIGACPATQSKLTLRQHVELVLSTKRQSQDGLHSQAGCDKCLENSRSLKAKLNPILVGELIRVEIIVCMDEFPEGPARTQCYARVAKLNDDLNYLMTHSPEEFCKYIGACPSARLQKLISLFN